MSYPLGHCFARRDDYPSAAALMLQPIESIPQWVDDHFNKPGRMSAGKISDELEQHKRDLTLELECYENIRLNGAAVLSEYDVKIAFSGNAERAASGSIALIYNHIYYYRLHIEWVRLNLPGLASLVDWRISRTPVIEPAATQLSLF